MNQQKYAKALLVLGLIGLFLSSYLLYGHYSEEKDPFCDALGGGCDLVNKGVFSELDGIINFNFGTYYHFPVPVSLLGIFGFLIICAMSYYIMYEKVSKATLGWFFGFLLIGLIFNIYITYLEFWVLGTFCPYCDITKLIYTAIFIIVGALWYKQ